MSAQYSCGHNARIRHGEENHAVAEHSQPTTALPESASKHKPTTGHSCCEKVISDTAASKQLKKSVYTVNLAVTNHRQPANPRNKTQVPRQVFCLRRSLYEQHQACEKAPTPQVRLSDEH